MLIKKKESSCVLDPQIIENGKEFFFIKEAEDASISFYYENYYSPWLYCYPWMPCRLINIDIKWFDKDISEEIKTKCIAFNMAKFHFYHEYADAGICYYSIEDKIVYLTNSIACSRA